MASEARLVASEDSKPKQNRRELRDSKGRYVKPFWDMKMPKKSKEEVKE